jgi:hypothetical protein
MSPMITGSTMELGLTNSIGLLAMTTPATGLAGIGGVKPLDRHACQPGLVGDEVPELIEGPSVEAIPLPPAEPDPFADAPQVFKGNPANGALRRSNEILADAVVGIAAVPALPQFGTDQCPMAAAALVSVSSLGCLAKIAAPFGMLASLGLDLLRGMAVPIGIDGDVLHPQIDTDEVLGLGGLRSHILDLDAEEVMAVPPLDQLGRRPACGPSGVLSAARPARSRSAGGSATRSG